MNTEPSPIRILVVEDSQFQSKIIQYSLGAIDQILLDTVASHAAAIECLEARENAYDIALVDLNLPDSDVGECAREILSRKISTIVFSGVVNSELKAELFQLGIIDYIAKDSPVAIDYLQKLVMFLAQQQGKRVLVANNNTQIRRQQVRMLENLKLSAWACRSRDEALKLLDQKEEFSLALIGKTTGEEDGIELVRTMRSKQKASELAIVAIPEPNTDQASQYLRYGANDFLQQPYTPEEFQCRIRNAVQMQQQLQSLERAATRDFLTGLLNRRAFFEVGEPIFAQALRKDASFSLAMIDIDHFKNVNDTYGHDVGDKVIYEVAQALNEQRRSADVLARFGGEEFCLLMPDLQKENVQALFERYQESIANIDFSDIEPDLKVTVSIGIATTPYHSPDQMIKMADEALYEAKETGRNRFIIR
ncbi:MAG: diguanylate cyclase [Kordiimonas sp.]